MADDEEQPTDPWLSFTKLLSEIQEYVVNGGMDAGLPTPQIEPKAAEEERLDEQLIEELRSRLGIFFFWIRFHKRF